MPIRIASPFLVISNLVEIVSIAPLISTAGILGSDLECGLIQLSHKTREIAVFKVIG